MIDPFTFYFEHGVDGAQAIEEELRWIRSTGLMVRGVGGYSRAGHWGADSMEMFRGFAKGNRVELLRGDVRVPLQVLDFAALALDYDSAFVRPRGQPAGTAAPVDAPYREPGSIRALDSFFSRNPIYEFTTEHVAWLVGRDIWAWFSNTGAKPHVQWPVSFGTLASILRTADRPGRVLLVVNPALIAGDGHH
jgi:hypothetical protein